jgi:hypothetical protein
MLPDVLISRAQGGLGRQQPTNDGISALLTQGVAIAGKLALGTDYELRSLVAAEALGIVPTGPYAQLHQHLSEYFRLSPGAVLILRVVAQSVALTDMLDRTQPYAKSLLAAANGRVKQLGVVLNPAAGYVPNLTGGIDADVTNAIAKGQALAAEEFKEHRPVLLIVGAHSLTSDPAQAPDLTALASEFVACVAGSDATSVREPAVGTLLGAISAASVNESVAWVQKFNLTGDGAFLNAGLCSGELLSQQLPGDLAAYAEKGFIVVRQHAGIDGFYFSDSPTCTVGTSDYATMENVRTSNKAARLVRTALLPSLNGPLPVNADGTLQAQAVGELQGKAVATLSAGLSQPGEVSALAVYIDPNQNVVSTSQLAVQVRLVPVGVARQIKVDLGLTAKLK